MELTNIALAYQLDFLSKELTNGFINKIQCLPNGFTKIKLHTKQGSKELIIADKGIYISNYRIEAKKNSSGFEGQLKSELYNKRIDGFSQPNMEREAVIEFFEHKMICEFYPEPNIVLTDKKEKIIAFKKQFKEEGRRLKKGEQFPERKNLRLDPRKIEAETLKKEIEKINAKKPENPNANSKDVKNKSIQVFLSETVNSTGPLIEVILKEAGIEKNKRIAQLNEQETAKIAEKMRSMHEIKPEKLNPVLWQNKFIYPFPLKSQAEQKIDSINSALEEEFKKEMEGNNEIKKFNKNKNETPELTEQKSKALSNIKMEKSIRQQIEAKKKFEEQIKENQGKGEMIYENFSEIEEITNAVRKGTSKGLNEKQLMQTFKEAGEKGNKTAQKIKKIDLKTKEITVEI